LWPELVSEGQDPVLQQLCHAVNPFWAESWRTLTGGCTWREGTRSGQLKEQWRKELE
jgi:hypothetical protein